jgi:hypothetical protein
MLGTEEVGWDPMYEGQLPWFTKVFVIYLALVLLVSAFRAINLLWRIRWLQKTQKGIPNQVAASISSWESRYAKVASIKNLSMLTFLLCVLFLAWSTTQVLLGIAVQKVTGSAFLAGAMVEVLTTFSLGIFVCAVLYAVAMFCEGALARQKARFDRPKE